MDLNRQASCLFVVSEHCAPCRDNQGDTFLTCLWRVLKWHKRKNWCQGICDYDFKSYTV